MRYLGALFPVPWLFRPAVLGILDRVARDASCRISPFVPIMVRDSSGLGRVRFGTSPLVQHPPHAGGTSVDRSSEPLPSQQVQRNRLLP